jgi:hypothetical protein
VQLLREHYDAEWFVLSVRELREYERVLVSLKMGFGKESSQGVALGAALLENAKAAILAGVEVHNKPIFPYRYEVCTVLVINAWELALKAYIARELASVKLVREDGTAKPFPECLACVSSVLGRPFEATKCNLEVLYEYRNKVVHFYHEDMDVVVLGLLKASVLFFVEFLEEQFRQKLDEQVNLVLLPIGFTKPTSPLDFVSNRSAAKDSSEEVRTFLQSIGKRAETLMAQGIDDSIIVNYSLALVNESRIKNADLIAAINNAVPQANVIAIHNIVSSGTVTFDASAKQIRIAEDSVFGSVFTETYDDVLRTARRRFSDFRQNARFNGIMAELKKDPSVRRTRLLNPRNPNGGGKDFYHRRIYDELAKHYTAVPIRASSTAPTQAAH